jgi:signal transduction histidine kinase
MSKRHSILVVDDEADVVDSLQDLLRLDYRVLGATRPSDALQILKQHEIHIVMSDQRMPGMTGVELLHQIHREYPEAIRLLITGYADIKAVVDAINQGSVYRYISKPWNSDELQTIIRQAADQHDLLAERRQLIAELQVKNIDLERANAGLADANRQLKQANELKEAFIRVASHELRTPLTILLGMTELAIMTPDLTLNLRQWLEHIHRAGKRLNHLTEQLTQMLVAGNFERPLRRQPTDLSQLLDTAVRDINPFVEQRHQRLELDIEPALGSLSVDAYKIHDCVSHLLLNAIKFTPDGGLLRLSAARVAGGVEIKVVDSGLGIDQASLPHIFAAFFTAFDVSRHSSGQYEFGKRGLGLGLSLVKGFVEMHGGKVRVDSESGKGSTFTIFLPETQPAAN